VTNKLNTVKEPVKLAQEACESAWEALRKLAVAVDAARELAVLTGTARDGGAAFALFEASKSTAKGIDLLLRAGAALDGDRRS